MMIKYELKKLWNRPLVWLILLGVLVCHILFINTNHLQNYANAFQTYYEKYEGNMDETWQLNTIQKYNEYLQTYSMDDEQYLQYAKSQGFSKKKTERLSNDLEIRLLEEYKYSNEFTVLSFAYDSVHFKENLVNNIKQVKHDLQIEYPQFDTTMIDNVFLRLLDNHERYTFSMDYGYRMMQGVFTMMIRSFIILMIAVLATLFTTESAMDTLESIVTTKKGRKKMQRSKFVAALISAVMGWFIIISVSLFTIYITLGFNGGNMYVQDFLYNSCPYDLNSAEYLVCISIISLFASICIGACFAFLSAIVKKDSIAIMSCVTIMLILPFFNNELPQIKDYLYFHPSNFISGNYLLNSFDIRKVGNIYIPTLYVALGFMVLYIIISYCFIHFRKPEKYLFDSRNASK